MSVFGVTLVRIFAFVYDPSLRICPFVFPLKVLIQKVCREKLGWNDILSEECLKELRLISNDGKLPQDIEIIRWYGDFKATVEVELHGFSDASMSGYGYCIYIRYCLSTYSYIASSVFFAI